MAGDVSFKFKGDSSDLRAELQKVEKNLNGIAGAVQGTTNKAKKGFDNLKKPVREWDQTLAGASNNNKKFKVSLDTVQNTAGETASVMSGLATSLSVISPQAGAAVRAIGDLATGLQATSRGGSTVFAILGPVGVAVAALGAAYVALKSDLDDANEGLKVNRDRLEDVEAASRKVKEAVLIAAHAELQAAKARGEATQAQVDAAAATLDEMAIAQQSTDLFKARREALTAERDAIRTKIAAQEKSTAETKTAQLSTSLLVQAHGAGTQAAKDATQATAAEAAQLKALQNELKNSNKRLEILDTTQNRYKDALKRTKDAQREATKATSADGSSQAEQAEAIDTTTAALDALRAKSEAAAVTQLSARHKILHAYQREIEEIRDLAAEHGDNTEIIKAADEAAHNRQVQAMRELDALDKQNADKRKARLEEIRQKELESVQAGLGAMSDLASATADAFELSAESRSKADRKAAMKAFRTQKALSGIAATLAFAEATISAWRDGNAVLASIRTAAATMAYGVSIAKINAQQPTFHTGTGLVRAPSGVNEMNARLRDGEAVSTPLGAELIGRGNIERANAGMSPGGGSGVAFQYEHRVFSRFIRDNVRTRGPLGKEQDRKIHVGLRRA